MYSQAKSSTNAPSEIWAHWNIALTKEAGRAAIARYAITQGELADWDDTPP